MRRIAATVVFLALGCSFQPSDVAPRDAGVDAFALPNCTAQRTVHLVGGNGGLAWFTVVWPVPEVIDGFVNTYAYDEPSLARPVAGDHPLYARRAADAAALWSSDGAFPHPSAFLIGVNESHSSSPSSTVTLGGQSVIARGAARQVAELAPPIGALVFGDAPFGAALNAPTPLRVDDIGQAIAAVRDAANLSAADAAALAPDSAIIASWLPANSDQLTVDLAERLLFTANLFERGLVGTVVLTALPDDPHGAWDAEMTASRRADALTFALAGFYDQLSAHLEPTCGAGNAPLNLADNVVTVVSGDTPKNSFNRTGWPDGTVANTNLLYVRSNGWLGHGWFSAMSPTVLVNFDPLTGELDASASDPSNDGAAISGVLYAISRGDLAFVQQFDSSPFGGLLGPLAQ